MTVQAGPGPGDFTVPDALPVLPLRDRVVFPLTTLPLAVEQSRSVRLVDDAMRGNQLLVLVAQRDAKAEPAKRDDLHRMGTVGVIHQVARAPDGSVRLMVQGLERVRVLDLVSTEPYLVARVEAASEPSVQSGEFDALRRAVLDLSRRLAEASPDLPAELAGTVESVTDPRHLVYFVASVLPLGVAGQQELLETAGVTAKLRRLVDLLRRELATRELGKRIAKDHLNEHRRRIEAAGLPEEARREAERELTRFATLPPMSPERDMIVTYLEWMASLPWTKLAGGAIDLRRVREALDEDHFGLEKVKERILQYLVARSRPILCFVGPPGVGKTSLGHSIARALGRRFARMSLGGVRDEAEIRGHRRTYTGALPGRIIQGLRRAETRNPVFMLDEIDKMGAERLGDPVTALLEVLDPAQNHTFVDNYLGVAFDLSQVLFIATASTLDTIPGLLRDRMEVLTLSGYTDEEKIEIARRYLIPKQLAAHGLAPGEVSVEPETLRQIVQGYTRVAGLRGLEREIARAARHRAAAPGHGVAGPLHAARDGVAALGHGVAGQLRAARDGVTAFGGGVAGQLHAARDGVAALGHGVAGQLRAARDGVTAFGGGVAGQLHAARDGVAALGHGVAGQLRAARDGVTAFGGGVAGQLHAARDGVAALGHGVAGQLRAARDGVTAFGGGVAGQLHAARDGVAALGHGVAGQLRAAGDRGAAFGRGVEGHLRATQDRATAFGRGVAGQLRTAGDRVAALGVEVAGQLHATRDPAAAFGRRVGDELRATRDRGAAFGRGLAKQLPAARDRATAFGRGVASQLRATWDRATAFGHGVAGQFRAMQDRGAAFGRGVAEQLPAIRARAAALLQSVVGELRTRSFGARLAWPERRAPRSARSLAAWRRGHSWRGRSRVWIARAGAVALGLVTVLLFAPRPDQPPPDPRVAASPQIAARPRPPAAPAPARARPAQPAPGRPSPETRPRDPEPGALATAQEPRASRAVSSEPAPETRPRDPEPGALATAQEPRASRAVSSEPAPETRPRDPEPGALATAQEPRASRAVVTATSPAARRPDSLREYVLLDAAESGDLLAVRSLLDSGTSPSARDLQGRTVLMTAMIHGHSTVAELLLARGANVNARDDQGVTALMLAARDGDVALVQRLLDRGASVDARTRDGWTALTYAARKAHPEIARRLLRAGADPTLTDRSGWSALMYASSRAAETNPGERSATADTLEMKDLEAVEVARRRYNELVSLLSGATKRR